MLEGGCLCGAVEYRIKGRPRFMYQCHCGKCRAASGASFVTNLIVDAEKLEIRAGKESLTAYESSPGKFRRFCSRCGSPIYSQGEKTKRVVSVRAGTLKQDPGLRAAYDAFVGSKAAWVEIGEGRPCFADWPDPALVARLMEESQTKNGA